MKDSFIETKSFDFAVRIVNLYKHLTSNKNECLTAAEFQSLENDLMPIIKLLTSICKKTDDNIS